MEIERRQLIDDDADRHILALPSVHSRNKSVKDKGIQRTDYAFHFRVIGDKEVRRILGVRHLQIKVIAILMEYPI